MVPSSSQRGALIVFEGCDKVGKSTQATRLVQWLRHNTNPHLQHLCKAEQRRFPNRESSVTGGVLDDYLQCKVELPDAAVHLLFSANRWEEKELIQTALSQGTTLVLDRYAYSGVAFTTAKGVNLDWCKGPDRGLPRPDLILFLNLQPNRAQAREDYGKERYEQNDFQAKVRDVFLQLQEPNWKVIDAGQNVESVEEEVREAVRERLSDISYPISSLWTDI